MLTVLTKEVKIDYFNGRKQRIANAFGCDGYTCHEKLQAIHVVATSLKMDAEIQDGPKNGTIFVRLNFTRN